MLNAGTFRSYSNGVQALMSHPGVRIWPAHDQQGNQAQPHLFKADVSLLLNGDPLLQEEVFGPTTIVVEVADKVELRQALTQLARSTDRDIDRRSRRPVRPMRELLPLLEQKVGRVLFNGYPTGVEVCDAMVHGGPYPATSDARGTSVGQPGHRAVPAPGVLPELPGRLAAGSACKTPIRWGLQRPGRWPQPPRAAVKNNDLLWAGLCGEGLPPLGREAARHFI